MVKLTDVSIKAKVSIATASLALNDSNLVSDKTKKKVKKIAKELNYSPNIHAKRLSKGKSYNLTLMINSEYFFNPSPHLFYLKVIGGMIKESENTEYTLNFSFFNQSNSKEISKKLKNINNFDGIMILDIINEETHKILTDNLKIPFLLVDNHMNFKNTYSVDNDDYGGAYKAIQYLIELGHRKIGYIGLSEKHPLGRECILGFNQALSDNNLEALYYFKRDDFEFNTGRIAAKQILKNKLSLTAYYCANDYIAIGVMDEFRENKVKIPGDISIVGMDDNDLSSEVRVPLTTIKINMEKIGSVSIKKIISLINKKYIGEIKTTIPNKLIIRNSCSHLKL